MSLNETYFAYFDPLIVKRNQESEYNIPMELYQ